MVGVDVPIAILLEDEAATMGLAARLAGLARPGDVIALSGPLGAGKTTFARAFIAARCAAAGLPAEDVPSPTFTLVQTYDLPQAEIWHVDLYRLSGPDEADELALDEAFASGISLIEWPDRLSGRLPAWRLDVRLDPAPEAGPSARRARLITHDGWAERLAAGLDA
jgi:tRNA threonylcarbamoyladenosine biosynthesis protein TsaE